MKYEIYHQMPTIVSPGTPNTLDIVPDATVGNISRLKSVYIDLPTGITLSIPLSTLGTGVQSDITSGGNEAGSIVFRTGIVLDKTITVTVTNTGSADAAYSVKIVTEVETAEVTQVAQAGFSGLQMLLIAGLAAGYVYMVTKKKQE